LVVVVFVVLVAIPVLLLLVVVVVVAGCGAGGSCGGEHAERTRDTISANSRKAVGKEEQLAHNKITTRATQNNGKG